MENDILLESGTNELEVLEFTVNQHHFGINVAKICELLPYEIPTSIPNAHPCIEGIFMPRDTVVSMVNLFRCLGEKESKDSLDDDMLIMTNFNELYLAFHVNQIVGIHRMSWSDLVKPQEEDGKHQITGMIEINGSPVSMLDFEQIVSTINPETGLRASQIESIEKKDRKGKKLLLAEDSQMLSQMICDCLVEAGYEVEAAYNGQEALDQLDDTVDGIITDIEMPVMDGHRLTHLIKEDEQWKHLPVIIFSSLINEEMRKKGEELGADAQLSKPEIGRLVEILDGLLLR